MVMSISTRFRGWCVGLAAAAMLGGCASVSLNPNYNPPQIQMPGAQSPAAPSTPQPENNPGVQVMPVTEPAPPQPIGSQPIGPQSNAPQSTMTQGQGQGQAQGQTVPSGQSANLNESANLITLSARMDGRSVVPPVATGASGSLDAIFDKDSMVMRWKASWDGLSSPVIGVQFSGPAGPGQNAPATMIWPGPFGVRYEGHATLTTQQRDEVLAGRWYVTVMTANYPQGELRGQVHVVY